VNTSKISFLMLMCFAVLWIACRTRTPGSEIPEGPDPFDKRFLVWLINHHNDDDRMVGPCATKKDIRQELRDFCVNVDQQHRERVERMKGWLRDWYSSEYPRTDDIPLWLGGLEGQEFEREFLKEYIGHHADAVDPLSECAKKAEHPELRQLCQRIAPRQKTQVQDLKRWRCEWFKDCD
jgi:uncharacterized protein (DUF305 family)